MIPYTHTNSVCTKTFFNLNNVPVWDENNVNTRWYYEIVWNERRGLLFERVFVSGQRLYIVARTHTLSARELVSVERPPTFRVASPCIRYDSMGSRLYVFELFLFSTTI